MLCSGLMSTYRNTAQIGIPEFNVQMRKLRPEILDNFLEINGGESGASVSIATEGSTDHGIPLFLSVPPLAPDIVLGKIIWLN